MRPIEGLSPISRLRWRFLAAGRRGLRQAGLDEGRSDLLHAVDEFDGRSRRQHNAARRITAGSGLRIGLYLVDTLHGIGQVIEDIVEEERPKLGTKTRGSMRTGDKTARVHSGSRERSMPQMGGEIQVKESSLTQSGHSIRQALTAYISQLSGHSKAACTMTRWPSASE